MVDRIRIDKWLWHARFYRTRASAKSAASAGIIRLNGHRVDRCSAVVGLGDVLTLPRGRDVAMVRVLAIALRRGPPAQAQVLYEVLTESAA